MTFTVFHALVVGLDGLCMTSSTLLWIGFSQVRIFHFKRVLIGWKTSISSLHWLKFSAVVLSQSKAHKAT